MPDPRYPIGKYEAVTAVSPELRREWIRQLRDLPAQLADFVHALTPDRLEARYREGGWTVRQVVHHLADAHMNATIRVRLALTEERPQIKVWDENRWAELDDARSADVEPSLQMLAAIHERLALLLEALSEQDFQRAVLHPERGPLSVEALAGLYAWHGRHHLAQIRQVQG